MNIRSMAGDTSSLKASGGAGVKPQTIKLENVEESGVMFKPETVNQLPGQTVEGASYFSKALVEILGSVILVVALGLVGYYVIYPMIYGAQQVPVAGTPVVVENTPAVGTPVATVVTAPHQTLFVKPVSAVANGVLADLTSVDIIEVFQNEAKKIAPAGTLKEVVFSKDGAPVAFRQYLNALAPDIAAAELSSVAEDNFTAFLYYDSKGIWPGYVAQLKPQATMAGASAVIGKLESADISKFYVAYPGIAGEFKTGPFKNAPIRYAKFSQPGASFNYGILGNYVLISASFDGFKAAADLLGM